MKQIERKEQKTGSIREKEEEIFGRMAKWSRTKTLGGFASCGGGCSSCGCSSCGCGN